MLPVEVYCDYKENGDACKQMKNKSFEGCSKCNLMMATITCARCDRVIRYPIGSIKRPKYCSKCRMYISDRHYNATGEEIPTEAIFLYNQEDEQHEPANIDKNPPRIDSNGQNQSNLIDTL